MLAIMLKKNKKIWRTISVVCLALLLAGCDEPKEKEAEAEIEHVRYLQLKTEELILTSILPGRVSPLALAEIRPQVDGIITERLFEEGSTVQKGQTLYRIDAAPYQAAYAAALASLNEAKAHEAALALLEKRQRRLLPGLSISRQDLDNTISQHGQALARVSKAQADLENAAINLSYTEIKAPVSGRIGAATITIGALVTANQPSALAVIRQIDRVYIDMTQSSADIIRLRRAIAQRMMSVSRDTTKVRLKLEDGSPYTTITQVHSESSPHWIQGELLFSEVFVEQSTGNVKLRAVIDNPDGLLLPGMYVTAIIEEGTINNAMLIPQRSVMANNMGGHAVFLLQKDDDTFRVIRREVTLDRAIGNRWLIKDGLKEGDLLVVDGLQKAVPGMPVKGVPSSSTVEGK